MGTVVLIYGRSGTGKSRSLKNFAEDEILLVNVEAKPLPFKKKFKFVAETDNIGTICEQLAKMPCKAAVIDDCGYIMTHRFMRQHREMTGNKQFEMYNQIADDIYNLISFIKRQLPPEVIVYLIFHEETNDFGKTGIRTIGKLLDQKVNLEGTVTIALRAMCSDGRYYFRTQNNDDVSKSPELMFDSTEIPNDLKDVDTKIREYWSL